MLTRAAMKATDAPAALVLCWAANRRDHKHYYMKTELRTLLVGAGFA